MCHFKEIGFWLKIFFFFLHRVCVCVCVLGHLETSYQAFVVVTQAGRTIVQSQSRFFTCLDDMDGDF